MPILIFFVAHWYISLFFQTFFHHRYASHAAFTMSKTWERIFFVLSWIGQGSSYLSPRAYGIMHRMHHAYADTEKDPHSPKYSKNLFDMMWRTYKIYAGIYDYSIKVDDKFTRNVPDWPAFDKFATSNWTRAGWVAAYIAFYAVYATSPWMYLLIPIHVFSGPVHGAVINWFAHKFGYENYETRNTSKNLLHVDILMLGESYHNNHHHNPSSVNFGVRKHEIDPVYPFILLFDKLGIVKIKKQVKPFAATKPLEPMDAVNKTELIEEEAW